MTLSLSLATPAFALQVTDRLVTVQPSGAEYDSLANKNVVFVARDGVVSIAYSGLAYIDGEPKDAWIARSLMGERRSAQLAGVGFGRPRRWLDLGQSVRLLQDDLALACSRRPGQLELVIVGWKWKLRRYDSLLTARPIIWVLSNMRTPDGMRGVLRIWRAPRLVPRNAFGIFQTPPGRLTRQEIEELASELPAPIRTANEAEQMLVKSLRSVARAQSGVGEHCMSLLIAHPSVGTIRTRYLPSHGDLVLADGAQTFVTPVGFSPWVVGPNLFASPSLMLGGWSLPRVGAFAVRMESPAQPQGNVKALLSSQRRRLPPDVSFPDNRRRGF